MCNELLVFLECGHQAIESSFDYCCYVLNTFDRLALLNYSQGDPRITENDRKCGENYKTVLKTIAGVCQECQLTASLKYLDAETNMRSSPIGEAFWPGDSISKSPRNFISDDCCPSSDWSSEMEGTPTTNEAHTNWPLQIEDSPWPTSPMRQSKLLWIHENATVETLYTAVRAPSERSSIPLKQQKILWIEENPVLTLPSLASEDTSRTALTYMSSLGFEGEPLYFFPPFWWERPYLCPKETPTDQTPLLEHLVPISPHLGHRMRAPSAKRSPLLKGGFSGRGITASKKRQ